MSFVGKLLVVLNTGLSIVFLMWAVSVYFEKVNWFTPQDAKDKQAEAGIIEKSQARLKELGSAANDAARRWGYNAYEVAVQEYNRPLRRDFYRSMLASVQTGKGQVPGQQGPEQVNPAVQTLKTELGTGLVEIAQTKDPIKSGQTPLESIDSYKQLMVDAANRIEELQGKITALIKQQQEATDVIV